MYRTTITLKGDIPLERLNELRVISERHFNNRAGKILLNKNDNPFCLVFEGEEKDYGCLKLGIHGLYKREQGFKDYVYSWNWLDEDEPEDEEDVLEALSVPIY